MKKKELARLAKRPIRIRVEAWLLTFKNRAKNSVIHAQSIEKRNADEIVDRSIWTIATSSPTTVTGRENISATIKLI